MKFSNPLAEGALAWALLAAVAGVTGLLARSLTWPSVGLELGASDYPFIDGPWSRAHRNDIDPPAARDGITSFYSRALRTGSTIGLPLTTRGRAAFTLRAKAAVPTLVSVLASAGRRSLLVEAGPWSRYRQELPAGLSGKPIALQLVLQARSPPPGSTPSSLEVDADFVAIESADGLRLTPPAVLLLAALPVAVFLVAIAIGHRRLLALLMSGGGGAAVLGVLWAEPLSVLYALPRLIPVALLSGWVTSLLLGRRGLVAPADRRRLAWLVAVGITVHASLVFLPNHNPPDLETHVTRTISFRDVEVRYEALLRYGSHLPTTAQVAAPATDLFGSETLVPYSPLPYFALFGLYRLGFELHWTMTAFCSVLLMLVAAGMWVVASRLWSVPAAWVASMLFTLDLSVWHHLGRGRAPASFGAALATGALLFLAHQAERLSKPRQVVRAGVVLALGALGYASSAVLFGLFGVWLLALLALDAASLPPRGKWSSAAALALGGILALGLYYGHYLPGLLGGGVSKIEAEPGLFSGQSVFWIFRNEGRQSARLWALGFGYVLAAGLVAAPFALARVRGSARPVLVAWLGAWALVMVLKDPLLFPNLLRWGKEDQFLSPLLCLLIGAAVTGPMRPVFRWLAIGAALGGSLWLEARDFALHAVSLRL